MHIKVDESISIELINGNHAPGIFEMVNNNRAHLREWLPFVDRMQDLAFAENFVKGTMQRNKDGYEYAFVIMHNGKMAGRIGVYKIDSQNKIGEIGYWVIQDGVGKGIVTRSCSAIIDFCFHKLKLNRIEIKCGTENYRSQAVPERLNFKKEGIIREGELLYDKFIDLFLYALIKEKQQ